MNPLQLLGQAFRLYRANFRLFFSITMVFVPVSYGLGVVTYAWRHAPQSGYLDGAVHNTGPDFVLGLLDLLVQAALVKVIADVYLKKKTTFSQAYAASFHQALPLLLTGAPWSVLYVLSDDRAIFGGGLWVLAWSTFLPPIVVLERKAYWSAFRRGLALLRRWAWLILIAFVLADLGLNALLHWSFGLLTPALVSKLGHPFLVAHLPRVFLSTLVLGFYLTAATLLYFDSRLRKEGYDLEALAQEMGGHVSAFRSEAVKEA